MKKQLLALLALGFSFGQSVAQSWEVREGTPQPCQDIVFHPKTGVNLRLTAGPQGYLLPENAKMEYPVQAGDVKISFQFNLSTSSELTFWILNQYPITFKSNDLGISGGIGSYQPLESAGLASGLWQTCEVVFSAASDKSPAKIEQILLNGRLIQHQLRVQPESRKQGGFVFEATKGQGAFRNFSFLSFGADQPIQIKNLTYLLEETEGWERSFEKMEGKFQKNTSTGLTALLPTDYKHFILTYQGDLVVEKADEYEFTLDYQGVGELLISGKLIAGSGEYIYRVPASGKVKLEPGIYSFQYKYQKIWWSPGLGLFVGGTTFRPYPLHEPTSLAFPDPIGQVKVEVNQNQAEMIRGFMNFQGKKRTNAVSIGLPEKVSLAWDLGQAAPLYFWKGAFLDVTDMWHERGEPQLMVANGVSQSATGIPSFQPSKIPADSLLEDKDITFVGYELNDFDVPTVHYNIQGKKASITWKGQSNGVLVRVEADPLLYHIVDRAVAVEVFEEKSKRFWEKSTFFYRVNNRFIFPEANTHFSIEKQGNWTYIIGRSVLPQLYSIFW